MLKILVTGGAGFIGSNFIRLILEKYPDYEVVNLDKLTYAGNLDNLKDIESDERYSFVKADIGDAGAVDKAMSGIDAVINFAAESHVDRSIGGPADFIMTDVFGTYVLLEAARRHEVGRYIQISTDEVYGSIAEGSFTEADRLEPSSPYSASKAGGDMQVMAYHTTYGLPTIITRSSNNFGPYQYPEKIFPLFITNALEGKKLPLYGSGKNVRDWIYVTDNCEGIDTVLHRGEIGGIYNIGGGNERDNLTITGLILEALGKREDMIERVPDRLGHDFRYSIDCSRARALGWTPAHTFEEGVRATVDWYVNNRWWWEKIKSGEFARYYREQYGK
ncbi:MAG: dTDP-glucose 4,6-dehydratase [Actinomycetota bacterium]|nr:dTDP-glucose 4,6-dehydratase [Actinomycetota bacterium]MCL6094097.1 dTDP-glucose 4,6-dehydratase [Actinomycetota bacterium]MDA8167821.1 dTDP-glucose 4,6-dehydratase [Actinomycetota bacterium]